MTISLVGHATPRRARAEGVFRSAVTRTVKAATPAVKEGCKVASVIAGLLAVMIALAALDVWIWVPHFNY
jgi:hypothetical protein